MFGILIGFGLIFFTLFVGNFDILPDFLGYFLLFRGLDRLCYKSKNFKTARPMALVMSLLTLISAVAGLFAKGTFINMLRLLLVYAGIVVLYFVVKGIPELEEAEGKDMGSKKYHKAWYLFAVCQVLCTLPVTESPVVHFLITAGVIGTIAASIMLLLYFYNAKVVYDYIEAPEKEKKKRQKKLSRKERKNRK